MHEGTNGFYKKGIMGKTCRRQNKQTRIEHDNLVKKKRIEDNGHKKYTKMKTTNSDPHSFAKKCWNILSVSKSARRHMIQILK